jgi:hypothetical protein
MEIGLGKNTLVWMADGSFKKVISLKKGDLVDTFEGPAYVELVLAHRYTGTLYEYANAYMAPGHRIYDSGAIFDVTHAGSDLVLEDYNDFVYNIAVSNRSSVRVGYETDLDIKQNKGMRECYAGTLGDKALFDKYFWGTDTIIDNIKKVDDENIGYVVCEKPIVVTDDDGRIEDITF